MGDARVHGPGVVGGVEHFQQADVEQLRQSLATGFDGAGQGWPTCLHVVAIGPRETVRRVHAAVLETAALAIAWRIERRQPLLGETRGLFQHLAGQGVVQLGEGRHARPVPPGVQPVLDDEAHFVERSSVVRHR
ncbi:hypothetical protein D9M69_591750 [compost metagenome]